MKTPNGRKRNSRLSPTLIITKPTLLSNNPTPPYFGNTQTHLFTHTTLRLPHKHRCKCSSIITHFHLANTRKAKTKKKSKQSTKPRSSTHSPSRHLRRKMQSRNANGPDADLKSMIALKSGLRVIPGKNSSSLQISPRCYLYGNDNSEVFYPTTCRFLFQSLELISPFFSQNPFSLDLISTLILHVRMEQEKKSYKKALTSKGKQTLDPESITERNPTPMAAEAGVAVQNISVPSAEKANEGMSTINKPKVRDLDGFLKKLSKVEDNIKHLQETTIFLTFWKGTSDGNRLRNKLTMEWQFLKGEFELIDRTNNWFEVKFANPIDRQNVWDSRPYYAFGNLLVLLPWIPNFDPVTMKISNVDVWARILYLPTEYITTDLVVAIIEHNEVGQFIRLDPFTEKRVRIKYARACVSIKCNQKPKTSVFIPTVDGNYKSYKIWYEGISAGCGSCGDEDHCFENCPLRNPINRIKNYNNEKLYKKDYFTTNLQTEESSAAKDKNKKEWQEVIYRKGKNAYSIHMDKGSSAKMEEVADTAESHQQSKGRAAPQATYADQQLFQIGDQASLINPDTEQGFNFDNVNLPNTRPTEDDSFKTGNAGTSLTDQMKAVNVQDESESGRRKKSRDTFDTASTNSKRARRSVYDADDE